MVLDMTNVVGKVLDLTRIKVLDLTRIRRSVTGGPPYV